MFYYFSIARKKQAYNLAMRGNLVFTKILLVYRLCELNNDRSYIFDQTSNSMKNVLDSPIVEQ